MNYEKEDLLAGCFKNLIKRNRFFNYCKELDITKKEEQFIIYNSLKDRGYQFNFKFSKPEILLEGLE